MAKQIFLQLYNNIHFQIVTSMENYKPLILVVVKLTQHENL